MHRVFSRNIKPLRATETCLDFFLLTVTSLGSVTLKSAQK